MKQIYGNKRRFFFESEPQVYDKELRVAYVDIQPDTQEQPVMGESAAEGETVTKEGYSAFEVQLDGVMNYGHIKSLLVESAFPQKDEHAFAINAIGALLKERDGETLSEDDLDAIEQFKTFDEWRGLCAITAKEIMNL